MRQLTSQTQKKKIFTQIGGWGWERGWGNSEDMQTVPESARYVKTITINKLRIRKKKTRTYLAGTTLH